MPTLSPARPSPQRVIVAEVTWLLCARPLAAWWRLRCSVCGGNTAGSELVVRTARLVLPTDWQNERPRRGRPPKQLAAQD